MKKLLVFSVLRFTTHSLLIITLIFFSNNSHSQDSRANLEKYKNYHPDFQLSSPSYYYLPGDTVKIKLYSGSIGLVSVFTIKVYRITNPEQFLIKQHNVQQFSFVGKDSSNLLGLAEEMDVFTKKIYPVKDKRSGNFLVNDSIKILPRKRGVYLIRVFLKNKAATCGFFVTNLSINTRTTESSFLTYTSNRMTSEPVDSVKLSLFFNLQKAGEGTTSNALNNYVLTEENKKQLRKLGYINPFIIAVKGVETAVSDPAFYFYLAERPFNAYIITSQPVYRPPARVDFKISVRNETSSGYDVYSKQKMNVYVKDESGANIYRKQVSTDEFGSFSDSVNIGKDAPLGAYKILTEIVENETPQIINEEGNGNEDNNENPAGEYTDVKIQSFEQVFYVEEYKKPEYKVEVKTDKEQYGGSEKIEITAQADYYFGSPVQDGEVQYHIYKKPLYRPWWYYSEYSWWYRSYYSISEQTDYENSVYIFTGSGRLNDSGRFTVSYKLDEDFKEGKKKNAFETDYMYIVSVSVTDKSRRMVSSSKSVNVTRSDYFINAHTDRYVVIPGEKIGLTVNARDFSDKPVEANYLVSVNRITYDKNKKITTFVNTYNGETSYNGSDMTFIDTDSAGYYEMEVTSFDSKNVKISVGAGCYVSSGKMNWWNRKSGTIEILPEKDTYEPGDTARALVMIPHDGAYVLVTCYNRHIVSTHVEKIGGSSAYISVPVTESSSPNFFFSVSYSKDGSFYTNSSNIAVIPEKKFLNVELTSDKPVYKPREEGTINVSVRDKLGNPVKNTEVTLGMVDESIYAIRPDNIPDIRSVFYSAGGDITQVAFNHNQTYWGNSNNSSYRNLFEMYDYKSNSDICRVSGKIFDERGGSFGGLSLVINGEFLASNTNKDGNFEFIIPEGEYKIQLASGDYVVPGEIKVNFKKDSPNLLEIKTTLSGILFGIINGEFVQLDGDIINYTSKPGTIYGTVFDETSNEPIVGAIVKLESTNKGDETDEKGYFEIRNVPDGIYNITAYYIGFNATKFSGVKMIKGKGLKINFELSVSGVTTDTMEIVAQRKEISVDQSGRLITSENIQETGIRGIENIVAKTTGIVDENGNQINLRGGRTAENLIIVDGVATNDQVAKEEKYVEAVPRNDFRDAVLWMPSVYTDENGNAQLKVKFPDNLTTWRIMAKAITKGTEVGQNSYSVIERKDLIIRVEVPRFFQQNDEVTVSTIVHNYLDEEKKTRLTLSLDNLMLAGSAPYEQEIMLGKNEERRIDWVVKVYNPTGIGNVYASALTNEESDAVEQKIPIQPFGLKINKFSSYDLDGSTIYKQNFEIPENIDLRSSYYQLSISPSIASSILGSLEYLIGYPYGCIEQTMSRFVPTVMVSNTFKEMNAPQDSYFTGQIPQMVKKGYEKVYSMQNSDGGWGWWKNSGSDPYMTAYVVYSMNIAEQNGYIPQKGNYDKSVNYLKKILEKKPTKKTKVTSGELSTRAFIAFALSSGNTDSTLSKLISRQFKFFERKELNPLAMAWLSLAAGRVGRTDIQRKYITDVMRIVNQSVENGYYWGGKIKRYDWNDDLLITTSMVIKAIVAEPVSASENKDVVERAVQWLLSQKKGNKWGNTQQNAYIIFALADYIKTYNELDADYTIKLYVNGKYAAEKQITQSDVFKPESAFFIPYSMLKNGLNEISIEKTGNGKAYVTGELTYFESDTRKKISETDNGFEITREYFTLKKVFNEKQGYYTYKKQPYAGNTSSVNVKSGDEIFVKVKVTPTSGQNDYFMLEEPLPAGCEYIKEDWAYPIEGENSYQGRSQGLWNWWYGDKDIRDNRIVYFASNLGVQEYEFSYLLRAQIPGTYNIMPPRGMLMYYPEINGSGENLVLKITDK